MLAAQWEGSVSNVNRGSVIGGLYLMSTGGTVVGVCI